MHSFSHSEGSKEGVQQSQSTPRLRSPTPTPFIPWIQDDFSFFFFFCFALVLRSAVPYRLPQPSCNSCMNSTKPFGFLVGSARAVTSATSYDRTNERTKPAELPRAIQSTATGRGPAAPSGSSPYLCRRWQALKLAVRDSRARRAAGGAMAGRLHPGPGANGSAAPPRCPAPEGCCDCRAVPCRAQLLLE